MSWLLPAIFIFVLVFALILLIYQAAVSGKVKIKARLKTLSAMQVTDEDIEPLSLPFRSRIIKPLLTKITGFFIRFLPANLKASLERKLAQCGNPRGMKAGTFISAIIVLSFIITLPGLVIPLLTGLGFEKALISALVSLGCSILGPILWLYMAAAKRITQIDRSLPDVVDLLVVCVEAGLSFDMAMHKVAERVKGPLGEEFARTLKEMGMGKTRDSALRDLGQRVGSVYLSSFLAMIIQSTQIGVSVGRVLRIQSVSMRRVRRQRARETANKAPVKMLIPLAFCIFPAIFIVLLGPAMLKILKAFELF